MLFRTQSVPGTISIYYGIFREKFCNWKQEIIIVKLIKIQGKNSVLLPVTSWLAYVNFEKPWLLFILCHLDWRPSCQVSTVGTAVPQRSQSHVQVTSTGTSEALNQPELWERISWCQCAGAREQALHKGLGDLGTLLTEQESAEHRFRDEVP